MSKFLNISAAACLLLGAGAAPFAAQAAPGSGPVYTGITGQTSIYCMQSYPKGQYDTDLTVTLVTNDEGTFVSGLLPNTFDEKVFVKADFDGSTLSIAPQKIYNQLDYYGAYQMDIYFSVVETDDNGEAVPVEAPFVLHVQPDGSLTDAHIDNPEEAQVVAALADLSHLGAADPVLYAYNCALTLLPYDGSSQCHLPAGAEPQLYSYTYSTSEGQHTVIDSLYIAGQDVYLRGLTGSLGAWVKGTLSDGQLTIPTGQFLGADFTYLMTLEAVTNFVLDEEGYVDGYDILPALTFTLTDEGSFVLEEGQCSGVVYADSRILGMYQRNLQITPFAGYEAAKPAAPVILGFDDLTQGYDQYYLYAELPLVSDSGERLEIENLEWAIYADDDLYVFSPDEGYLIDHDMTWFPAQEFVDNQSGYDLLCRDGKVRIYVYETLLTELGIQSRYTQQGRTLYSDITYVGVTRDETGKFPIRIQEVTNDDESGISLRHLTLPTAAADGLDLMGRQARQKVGLRIVNGLIKLQK